MSKLGLWPNLGGGWVGEGLRARQGLAKSPTFLKPSLFNVSYTPYSTKLILVYMLDCTFYSIHWQGSFYFTYNCQKCCNSLTYALIITYLKIALLYLLYYINAAAVLQQLLQFPQLNQQDLLHFYILVVLPSQQLLHYSLAAAAVVSSTCCCSTLHCWCFTSAAAAGV